MGKYPKTFSNTWEIRVADYHGNRIGTLQLFDKYFLDCLGRVSVSAGNMSFKLSAGQLYLMPPVSVHYNRDSLLLAALTRTGDAAWCFVPSDRSKCFVRMHFWRFGICLRVEMQILANVIIHAIR